MRFVMDKVALGQVFPSTSVSPANLHSINFSTITYHLGLVQYDSSGRSTQSPTAQIKKKIRQTSESSHLHFERIAYFQNLNFNS
jgi:hypothetical protein